MVIIIKLDEGRNIRALEFIDWNRQLISYDTLFLTHKQSLMCLIYESM